MHTLYTALLVEPVLEDGRAGNGLDDFVDDIAVWAEWSETEPNCERVGLSAIRLVVTVCG